ncbi:glycosyltransferase family 2 protein [Rhodococcus pyridinivorans]|uniref:glycosyltransferase family 2 protein n=1 Tax=Rhodococcus rhodochrous TaxID=1829 RepID=UPI001F48C999|nr:glycosyltransferase family 2 protein [Rhodococcus pyridinivorans]
MEDFEVVIPSYNSSGTIAAAVTSALEAGARKVIVIDDGSTDDSAVRARDAGAHVICKTNEGASKARKDGAREVTSPYFAFLDSDDELIKDGVHESIRMLQSDNSLAVAAGAVLGIAGNGAEKRIVRGFESYDTAGLIRGGYSPWPPAASVFSSTHYRLQDELDIPVLHTRYAEDYELLIRMSIVGDIACHSTLSCRYQLAGGKSHRAADQVVRCKESIREHYASNLGIAFEKPSERQLHAAAAARTAHGYVAAKKPVQALRWAVYAAVCDPALVRNGVARRIRGTSRRCRTGRREQ